MEIIKGIVETQILKGIASIEFAHSKSNSLPSELLYNLAKQIEDAGKNESIKIILIKSKGDKAFCAGASFEELSQINTIEEARKFFTGFARVIQAMKKCGKIIVARIQGKATGGGVGVAAAADYVFATQASSVCLSELNVGIGPFVIGPAVEHKIGKAAYIEMAVDAEFKSAEWAKQQHLFTKIFSDIPTMDFAIQDFLQTLNTRSTQALAHLKKIAWENTEHFDALFKERIEMSSQLILLPEAKNNIQKIKMELAKKN